MPTATDTPRRAQVVEALETTRTSMRRYRVARSLVNLALFEIGLAAIFVAVDLTWVISTRARAAGLGLMAVVAAGWLARMIFGSGRYGKEDAAVEVEAAFPELGQRVRTTLEYAEPTSQTAPAFPSLVEALALDTDRKARGLEFIKLVPWSNFHKTAFGLLAVVVGIGVTIASDPNQLIAARRLMLYPDHYSTLEVDPGDKTVKVSTDFTLKATIKGRAVEKAEWLRRPLGTDKPWLATSIAPEPRPSRLVGPFEVTSKDCQADFEYRVVAGEIESPVYRVKVVRPLVLKSIEAAVQPPSYTRKPPTVSKAGDFAAAEGSNVRFTLALDRAPKSARIVWKDAEGPGSKRSNTVPLAIQGQKLTGELPTLARDVRYEIVAEASDGMKLEPASYRIKVKPDAKPTITFVKPAESFAALATTDVPIKVEVGDDYGVGKVGIAYQVDDGPVESLYLDSPKDQPPSVEVLTTLYLEQHPLDYNSSLSYHAFVEDNKPVKPNRTTTELRYIDILPYKQEFAMSDASPGGGPPPSGTSVTLEELIARQRQALNRTFAHADDATVDPAVADRLSKVEAELALATDEFAKGLAARSGPIPPLEDAVQLLQSATVTLSENDINGSIPTEQSALASLIQARKNLRKLLGQPSPSAAQCKKFDRQQEQKLRKPPTAEEKPKEVELAKLEEDVRELAEDQKKFAEEIEPKGGGGAQFDKPEAPKPAPAKPGPPKPGSGSKPSPSERQSAAAKEAERLKKLAGEDKALTDLARNRMETASKEVKDAEALMKDGQVKPAADAAREAAADLDKLADQIAGLKSKDLAARLAKSRELAQETAKAERALAEKARGETEDLTARQQALADGAATLADLLKKLRSDAIEENRTLGRAIDKATEANAPGEIEGAMRAAIGSGQSPKAMQDVAGKLEGLARDLETARREFVQPQLEQLIAAERKAAEVDRSIEAGDKPGSEKGLAELAKALEALKAGEGPIRQASDALNQAVRSIGGGTSETKPTGKKVEGLVAGFKPIDDAVGQVAKALQAKIQELILNDALVDRDGAVPPGYKQLVQDYFRVLSDDLR